MGGRVSDKHITEISNLYNHLLPGDILADHGFVIKDSLGYYLATVKIPDFTKGKKQPDAIEVEQTRCIANVRMCDRQHQKEIPITWGYSTN